MTRRAEPRAGGAEIVLDGVPHRVDGAQVAVIDAGRVLLQLRPWPPGWELPGGHLDAGEEVSSCATREVFEETGLRVMVRGLVGVYRWSGLRRTADAVLWADPAGGTPRRSLEAIAQRWCEPERLPLTTFPWIGLRVADAAAAAAGAPPVLREQPITLRHVLFFGSAWAAQLLDGARRLDTARRTRR